MRQRIGSAVGAFALAALAGCAADTALRQDAKMLSIYVEKVKSDAVAFEGARDRVANARTSTLEYLETQTLKNEQELQRELAARQITQDRDWLAFFDSLKHAPEQIAKQREELQARDSEASSAIESARGAVDVRADKLTEASKALATLSDPPSTKGDVRFLAAFAKQVNAGIETKKADANGVAATSVFASQLKSVPR